MSRSGYSDDCDDDLALGRWRGQVASAIRGRRGQAFLKELLEALDAMPEKRLIANSFSETGAYCTLGVIGAKRGAEMPVIEDPDDYGDDDGMIARDAGHALNIARQLAAEIMFLNDECGPFLVEGETPEGRWLRMRTWVAMQIKEPSVDG